MITTGSPSDATSIGLLWAINADNPNVGGFLVLWNVFVVDEP
jgi:hypothetical protein